ncbi:MAG TPA: hypothetical protein VM512_10040 [Burkholderiaceae bacterium]|jgi:hypothetical protein|nr:hypothetical protein [Burkholderiaceae bacterium]
MAHITLLTLSGDTKGVSVLWSLICSSEAERHTVEADIPVCQNVSREMHEHDCPICVHDMTMRSAPRTIQLSFSVRPASNGALPRD